MQKRILPVAITALILISLISLNCTKLDTTDLGSDVLPTVDNVNTFEQTFPVISSQGVFSPDSTIILRTDDHAFGFNNDPVFGPTSAKIAFQLKPTFYPYYIGGAGDTLTSPINLAGVDSVVLCLKYKGSYGDTNSIVQVQVLQVQDNGLYLFRDSTNIYRSINYFPQTGVNVGFSPTTSIDVRRLADTVKYTYGTGYSVNTIRIRLSKAFADSLYNRDTSVSGPRNAFRSDFLFRQFQNGLAVVPVSGNQLIYTSLSDVDTKLEIHFRRKNNGLTDTVVNSLVLNSDFRGQDGYRSSSTANFIQRNRPGLPPGDSIIYLQTSPGTYANLSIPGLSGLSNRIVHRAELIVEEIPDLTNPLLFAVPNFLYIDLKDTTGVSAYKPVYYDLNQSLSYDPDFKNPLYIGYYPTNVDFTYFGGFLKSKTDVFGNPSHYYNFNITRYVQNMITNHRKNYQLRLSAPFNVRYSQYSPLPIPYGNNIAHGRVKVGGGNNSNYRLRMRIVYSNI